MREPFQPPLQDAPLTGVAWEGLKRALKDRALRIEELGAQMSLVSTVTLTPESVPLDVKTVLIGNPLLYYLLYAYDEDFQKLFKVKAEFTTRMDRTPESERAYALFVSTIAGLEKTPPFDRGAVARVIEYGSRAAEDQDQLSTRFGDIADLVREAAHRAGRNSHQAVTAEDVRTGEEARRYRQNLAEERLQELIVKGTVLLDTAGMAVGRINGLSVVSMGDYAFGHPVRLTATVGPGRRGLVSIEREVELSGPIHGKGVLILGGYLLRKYAQSGPLSLSASLVFEQSYSMVEGDSASLAELCVLLSALAGTPLRQDVAVTGSVNQQGEVQPVGGVTEKIEGFFDLCRSKGFGGTQGVLIPMANRRHLMLRDDVVEAVRLGQFHIWTAEGVDDVLQLLTGLPGGEPDADIDLEQKKPVLVDKDYYFSKSSRDLTPAWSPDSKWLAYSKQLKSRMSAIYLYSITEAKSTQVTDGLSDARFPVFDKDGKYLYFTASTDSGASMEFDLQSDFRSVTRSIYLMVLSKEQGSPLAPESDDERADAEKKKQEVKKDSGNDDANKDKSRSPEKVEVKIDFDNIGQRILALPMAPRRYEGLQVGKVGVLYAIEGAVMMAPRAEPKLTVHRFDLSKRKSDVAIDGVRSFRMSFEGAKMLYQQGDRWVITAPRLMAESEGIAPPPPAEGSKGALKTEGIEVRVDPRAEWKQMYREVWHIERDFFYDPGYHGLDLKAAEKRYEPYLENIASRQDLNYLFTEMLGELTVGHLFLGGGDWPEVKRVQTGLLGADYKLENGRYRFTRVYNGENWNPDLKAPLTQPGVNVVVGEYLLAVNGRELHPADNIYSFFV